MLIKKNFFLIILILLGYTLYLSEHFIQIAAGIAIFLFGMIYLEQGFNQLSGGFLEKILKHSTKTLPRSLIFGVISTSLMQSSSLISVITISFLSAGLITLAAGIGIIFGANLGTTTGAWLIAGIGVKVNIANYALPMLVFGLAMILQKKSNIKAVGYLLAGIGFLFLGIHYMKEGFEAFKENIDLMAYAIPGIRGLLLFTLIGVIATFIMQSSHASLVLIITALAANQISYENGLALAIGANIGTTITALLGSISANFQGKRLALAHLFFNVITGLVALVFIHQIAWLVDIVSDLFGIAENDYTLKLAVFHSIFNLIGIVIMIPFIDKLVVLLSKIIKEKQAVYAKPKFLNKSVLEFPNTMLRAVQDETTHLYEVAENLVLVSLHLEKTILSSNDLKKDLLQFNKPIEIDLEKEYEQYINPLSSEIVDFIAENHSMVSYEQFQYLYELQKISNEIVSLTKDAKHLSRRMALALKAQNPNVLPSYNLMRLHVVSVMKQVHHLIIDSHQEKIESELDTLLIQFAKENEKMDLKLIEMIKNGKVTAREVATIKSDKNYERNMVTSLVYIAHRLTYYYEDDPMNIHGMLSLTEQEIEEIKNSGK